MRHQQVAFVHVIDGEHLHLRAGENRLLHRAACGGDAIDGMRRRHSFFHGWPAPFALEFFDRSEGVCGGGFRVCGDDGGEDECEEEFHSAARMGKCGVFARLRWALSSGRSEQCASLDFRQGTFAFHTAQFVVGLKIEPKLRTVAEVLREAECCVGGDGALAMHDFIDAARRDGDVLCEPVFGEAERCEKFLDEHFAGGDEREQFGFHIWFVLKFARSVVIQNLNVGGPALRPAKAHAPLLVHADAVLSFAVAFEGFQPVARRNAQVFELCGCMDHDEFAVHDVL